MKVWWCETHEITGDSGDLCYIAVRQGAVACRMVEMELHPVGTRVVTAEALVIEKDDAAEIVQTALAFIAALERATPNALAQSKESGG